MDIEKFINKNEFIYHLTDNRNWNTIREDRLLLSAESIVNRSNLDVEEKASILNNRRPFHKMVIIDGESYFLRDQKPISEKNLNKCLTEGWTSANFIFLLNSRIFFWPNLKRLWSHYNRYSNENPIILKVPTRVLLEINDQAEFCRLNSGATRSNSYLNGAPPSRGEGTFLVAHSFPFSVGSVAEVTFPDQCQLPYNIYIGNNPAGPWNVYNFRNS